MSENGFYKDSELIDMFQELFISPDREDVELWIPPKSETEYLKDLNSGYGTGDGMSALTSLIDIYRLNTVRKEPSYDSEAKRDELIELMRRYALKDPDVTEFVGHMAMKLGAHCEKIRDYRSALKFYESSLSFEILDPHFRYFRFNNYGFCLNVARQHETAEKFLRAAVEMDPDKYNAWKNLGVSLEHQGQYEEAAECYFKAVTRSGDEHRSTMHLKRLIERRPILKEIPALKDFE